MAFRMSYLGVAAFAIAAGAFGGLLTQFIEHVRWISILVGVITGGGAAALGMTKTLLEIVDKRLEIRKKTRELKSSDSQIRRPTDDEIRKYGGVAYREVTRTAALLVNQQEHLKLTEFVADCREER